MLIKLNNIHMFEKSWQKSMKGLVLLMPFGEQIMNFSRSKRKTMERVK